jgi:hypothetical protein
LREEKRQAKHSWARTDPREDDWQVKQELIIADVGVCAAGKRMSEEGVVDLRVVGVVVGTE